ncbi:uncharacterized protein G2W53_006189 [Senna tora]|uniref:Uncharacterized protein n=1 Tax=Senna tora TaxID=362788 RepID=A0A835CG83_9FABA|nr:uncharacterized protein G2W53_006189 [Senna tora]
MILVDGDPTKNLRRTDNETHSRVSSHKDTQFHGDLIAA